MESQTAFGVLIPFRESFHSRGVFVVVVVLFVCFFAATSEMNEEIGTTPVFCSSGRYLILSLM